jgi:hypothetical protein
VVRGCTTVEGKIESVRERERERERERAIYLGCCTNAEYESTEREGEREIVE